MLYLGACTGASPPVCTPPVDECCDLYLVPDGLTAMSLQPHAPIDPADWDQTWCGSWSGLTEHQTLMVQVEILNVSATLDLPAGVVPVAVCGPVTTRHVSGNPLRVTQDFSGLSIAIVGSTITVAAASIIVQGWNIPEYGDSGRLTQGVLLFGVRCLDGDTPIIIEYLLTCTYSETLGTFQFVHRDALACIPPPPDCPPLLLAGDPAAATTGTIASATAGVYHMAEYDALSLCLDDTLEMVTVQSVSVTVTFPTGSVPVEIYGAADGPLRAGACAACDFADMSNLSLSIDGQDVVVSATSLVLHRPTGAAYFVIVLTGTVNAEPALFLVEIHLAYEWNGEDSWTVYTAACT